LDEDVALLETYEVPLLELDKEEGIEDEVPLMEALDEEELLVGELPEPPQETRV